MRGCPGDPLPRHERSEWRGEGARARALPEPGQDPRLVGWVTRWVIAALDEEGC